jgi:sugar-specific transcriptional regulator TrmB
MIVNKNLLEDVKKFGLNTYEAKIWTALLSRGISTAGELAEIANVPRSRSYDVLESLEKKGFIMMKVGKPIQYLAIKPDQVVERVQKKVNEDANFQLTQIEKLKKSDLLTDLSNLHSQGIETLDPLDITSFIRGRNNIHSQLNSMIKNAKKSVNIISSDEGLLRKVSILKKSLNKAKSNGVKINLCSPNSNITSKELELINEIGEFSKAKIEGRMVVIDDKDLLLMLAHDSKINPQYDTAIWINSKFLGNSLRKAFN